MKRDDEGSQPSKTREIPRRSLSLRGRLWPTTLVPLEETIMD